jgi:hypothetical protein
MTEPEGIQRKPSRQSARSEGIQPAPVPADETTSGRRLEKCPHCDHSLTAQDVAAGRCWFCEKRLSDPVEPKQPRTPFLATFFLGFLGAMIGVVLGYVLTGEELGGGSWTVSLCGGIGLAIGSATARAIYAKRQ